MKNVLLEDLGPEKLCEKIGSINSFNIRRASIELHLKAEPAF